MAVIRIPRCAIEDVFCPNCGKKLFTFDPNGIHFFCDTSMDKFSKMCKKHKHCPHCDFMFEEIDDILFTFYFCFGDYSVLIPTKEIFLKCIQKSNLC